MKQSSNPEKTTSKNLTDMGIFLASSMNPNLTFAEAERRAYIEGNPQLATLFNLLPRYQRQRNL